MAPSHVLGSALFCILGITACGSSSSGSSGTESHGAQVVGDGNVARSALSRDTAPAVAADDAKVFVEDQAAFAVSLYKVVATDSGTNVFFSPHGISSVLAMTYAGARGQTATEMKTALQFSLPSERLHSAFNALDLALAGRGAKAKDGMPFQLSIARSAWAQQNESFAMPFLDTLAVHHGAGVELVDFAGAPEPSRLRINEWVANRTAERIPELLSPNILTSSTRMVLVNAVYFNAAWSYPFDTSATTPAPFMKLDGATTDVATMRGEAYRGFVATDEYEAVSMPYDGNELDMVAIVPRLGAFASFEASLTGTKMLGILDGLSPSMVDLSYPKLAIEAKLGLAPALRALGMEAAFDEHAADFSGIGPWRPYVMDVLHNSFLDVNERGTEAAATTAVIVGEGSGGAPPPHVRMVVDRPFVVAIVDRSTKTLLFLGRVLEPNAAP